MGLRDDEKFLHSPSQQSEYTHAGSWREEALQRKLEEAMGTRPTEVEYAALKQVVGTYADLQDLRSQMEGKKDDMTKKLQQRQSIDDAKGTKAGTKTHKQLEEQRTMTGSKKMDSEILIVKSAEEEQAKQQAQEEFPIAGPG